MAELLKDYYNKELIEQIASAMQRVHTDFQSEQFVLEVIDNSWKELELKERIRKISTALRQYLPEEYSAAVKILCECSGDIKGGLEGMFLPDL
jgi:3-methyladenine DNA glycosylase AlkC